jgi:hypothetical protein
VTSAADTAASGRSVTVAVNRGRAPYALLHAAHKAEALLRRGAYVHWYERYGCERDDIAEAIESCRCVADVYAGMLQ